MHIFSPMLFTILFWQGLFAIGVDLGNGKKSKSVTGGLLLADGMMDNARLEQILKAFTNIKEGRAGYWIVTYEERVVIVITDETHNRMRIVSPVVESNKLEASDLSRVLAANFESALDARYALFNDYLWSVFIHPLKELSGNQFLDALAQVKRLADTYGSSYSSTEFIYNAK